MGLARRKFTRELKMAAIQQLDAGSSVAEVARAFEINPNLLHRWRNEFRHGPGNAFPGVGKRRWEEARVAQLEGPVAAAHHGQRCVLERELLVQWGEHLNRVGVASGK